ncbi:sensor histidine kinase [Mariniflexile sp.]|uniref:sensor histidine kinase n=1 Tax=Mariniflexile sp. TaxID=1979402 RepID=UPI00404841C2
MILLVCLQIYEILKYPNDNGIVIFVLGVLFILTVYHFLLYFQHRDTTYLFYSSYTFLILISHVDDVSSGFIFEWIKPIHYYINEFNINITWTYNLLYFIFAFTFIDLKAYSKKWHNLIFRSVYGIFIATVLFGVLYRITGDIQFIRKGDLIFLVSIFILSIVSYVLLFKIKANLKYYIIIGSLFLFVSSMTATVIFKLKLLPVENELRFTIFYIGILVENIFFSLGLGQKQKRIIQERNESQEKLIKQLKKNEKLREKIQKRLERDVKGLSKQAEADKLESIKIKFEKELAELKVESLRNQMNPHFIFNSLNSIKRYIIDNEKENAVYYLNKFSKLTRLILSSSTEQVISLKDELETITLYVNIENIRFNNDIEFLLEVDEAVNQEHIQIPPLILQPFIENAIWHGLSLRKTNKKLKLKIENEGDSHLKIDIIDNGIGRKRSAEIKSKKIHNQKAVGIKITEERLKNFSKNLNNDYSLLIGDLYDDDHTPLGTQITLKLPID